MVGRIYSVESVKDSHGRRKLALGDGDAVFVGRGDVVDGAYHREWVVSRIENDIGGHNTAPVGVRNKSRAEAIGQVGAAYTEQGQVVRHVCC